MLLRSYQNLAPEMEWEGANLPMKQGHIGPLDKPERALRDPAVFEEGGELYLLYAVKSESGIAIGKEGSSPARGRSGLELVNGIESQAIADTGGMLLMTRASPSS